MLLLYFSNFLILSVIFASFTSAASIQCSIVFYTYNRINGGNRINNIVVDDYSLGFVLDIDDNPNYAFYMNGKYGQMVMTNQLQLTLNHAILNLNVLRGINPILERDMIAGVTGAALIANEMIIEEDLAKNTHRGIFLLNWGYFSKLASPVQLAVRDALMRTHNYRLPPVLISDE